MIKFEAYKVYDKETGLFIKAGFIGTKHGKVWATTGALRNSLRLNESQITEDHIVIGYNKETGYLEVPALEFLNANKKINK